MGVVFRPFDGPPPPEGRTSSRFDSSWRDTIDLLARELRFLEAENVVVELALEERDLRIDGLPRANARMTSDAVRISFNSKWGPLRYETGEFTRTYWRSMSMDGWQANLRAVALAMEALRKVDRYGVSKRGEQYTGWKQLPASTDPADSIVTRSQAEELLLHYGGLTEAIKQTHPDTGGDPVEFRKVMRAKELVA